MPRNFDHLSPENDDEEKFGRLGVRPHGFFPGQRVQIADLSGKKAKYNGRKARVERLLDPLGMGQVEVLTDGGDLMPLDPSNVQVACTECGDSGRKDACSESSNATGAIELPGITVRRMFPQPNSFGGATYEVDHDEYGNGLVNFRPDMSGNMLFPDESGENFSIYEFTAQTVNMGKLKVGASSPAAGHTPPAFSAGARCRILGLKTAKQHNGVDAVMLEQQGERVLVKTQNSDELRVKPENLSERHECSYCGMFCSSLLACSKCRIAAYCDKKCQVAHWKAAHKKVCGAAGAAGGRAAGGARGGAQAVGRDNVAANNVAQDPLYRTFQNLKENQDYAAIVLRDGQFAALAERFLKTEELELRRIGAQICISLGRSWRTEYPRADAAMPYLTKALKASESLGFHMGVGEALWETGKALEALGRDEEALKVLY